MVTAQSACRLLWWHWGLIRSHGFWLINKVRLLIWSLQRLIDQLVVGLNHGVTHSLVRQVISKLLHLINSKLSLLQSTVCQLVRRRLQCLLIDSLDNISEPLGWIALSHILASSDFEVRHILD